MSMQGALRGIRAISAGAYVRSAISGGRSGRFDVRGAGEMSMAKIEQDRAWFYSEVERLKSEVAVLETQFVELEQSHVRAPALLQMLSSYLGVGAAGKLDGARFKLKLKQEELDQFKSQSEMLEGSTKHSGSGTVAQPELSPEAMGKLLSIIRSK